MAIVNIPNENRTIRNLEEITSYLAAVGITYEQWETSLLNTPNVSNEDILSAYSKEIEKLKVSEGYVTADVVDVKPDMPGLDELLDKFSREHIHEEDEVRFIIEGRGLFHINPVKSPVFSIEVEKGDLVRVPARTKHWFNLCEDKRIRAIRLFKNIAGWAPKYTDSGVDTNYQPLCFSTTYIK